MSDDSFADFDALIAGAQRDRTRRGGSSIRIACTRELADRLDETHQFEKGMLVEWKDGLRNRKFPGYGEPALVYAVLDNPIPNEREDPGSPYYREPLDMVIAHLDGDGDLLLWYVDSRRFAPAT